MDPLNPIKPTIPAPAVKRPDGKIKRREPGTGADQEKQDNQVRDRHNPKPDDHLVDELV